MIGRHRHAPTGETGSPEGAAGPAFEAERLPTVALVGRPNVGKSTFLARASHRFVETSNAPGTTVHVERRRIVAGGRAAWLVDLPGTRSLTDRPAGDDPFWRLLLDHAPDAILVVADSGDLGRHLPLVLACRELGLPVVLAANLTDEATAHGVEIDAGRLSQLLVAPVHRTTGRTGQGVDAAMADAVALAWQRLEVRDGRRSPHATAPASVFPFPVERAIEGEAGTIRSSNSLGAAVYDPDGLLAAVTGGAVSIRGAATLRLGDVVEPVLWQVAAAWAGQVERRRSAPATTADRLATLVTSPFPGLPLFIGVTLGLFATMVVVGGFLSGVMASFWSATVSPAMTTAGDHDRPVPDPGDRDPVGRRRRAPGDADDRHPLRPDVLRPGGGPRGLGLPDQRGRAHGSRLQRPGPARPDRRAPAHRGRLQRARDLRDADPGHPPGAPPGRLPGHPDARARRGPPWSSQRSPRSPGRSSPWPRSASWPLITFAASLAANAVVPGRQPALVLELAPLRRPVVRHVWAKAWSRFRSFVIMATPIMLVGSFVLGLIYESGLWVPLGAILGPITETLLGLPAIAGVAIVFAFLRKELALQLLLALAIVQYGAGAATLGGFMSSAQLFVFAIVVSISVPCAATLATLAGEFGWRPAIGMALATLVLALGTGAVIARALGIAPA